MYQKRSIVAARFPPSEVTFANLNPVPRIHISCNARLGNPKWSASIKTQADSLLLLHVRVVRTLNHNVKTLVAHAALISSTESAIHSHLSPFPPKPLLLPLHPYNQNNNPTTALSPNHGARHDVSCEEGRLS